MNNEQQEQEKKPGLDRKKKILIIVGGVLVLIALILFLKHEYKLRLIFSGRKVISFLFIGTDEKNHKGRTDTIFVAFYNTATRKTGIVIVPRDIRVRVKGLYDEKINGLYTKTGLNGLRSYLEDLLGVPIYYYAVLDLDHFVRLIDLMGPVPVFNDRHLRYSDQAGDLYIDLPAGEVELDGAKAMEYVRFRADERGDGGRSERQLEIIQVMLKKTLLDRDAFKNLRLLRVMIRYFKTNISFREVLWLLRNVGRVDMSGIETMRLPGVFREARGQSYIEIDPDSIRSRMKEFLLKLNAVTPEFDPSMVTVQVLNGTGVPGVAARLRNRLLFFGYNVVEFGNADREDYQKTLVLDRSGNSAAARRIAETLKIDNLYPKIDRLLVVDVTVIAGRDLLSKK